MSQVAEELVTQFQRMVGRDGGELRLVSDDGARLTVAYRPGRAAPDCQDDVCVLPQQELQQLMVETLRRRRPGADVVVEVLP